MDVETMLRKYIGWDYLGAWNDNNIHIIQWILKGYGDKRGGIPIIHRYESQEPSSLDLYIYFVIRYEYFPYKISKYFSTFDLLFILQIQTLR